MSTLIARRSEPHPPGTPPLTEEVVERLLVEVPGWALEGNRLAKTYSFKNFHETMAFVNALAWVAHQEDHHPDLEVSYNRCRVVYWTHTVGGLSLNDFICAAKIEALFFPPGPSQQ
jgi:4a-hydroxytetrahydrobiopterin dehydratase